MLKKRGLKCEVASGNTSLLQHGAVYKTIPMEPREKWTNLTDRTYIPSENGWARPIRTSYIPKFSYIPTTQLKKVNESFEAIPENYAEANQTEFPCTADDVLHAPIIPSCTFMNGNVKCNEGATIAWTVFTVFLLLIAICININSIRGKSF